MNEKYGHCYFQDHQIRSGLLQKQQLAIFLSQLIFEYRQKETNISYTFVDDDYLLAMNKQHLNHDTYTDIITFDLSAKNDPVVLADIYISVDRVKENAILLGQKYRDELLRVIIHGALHICGFKDKSAMEKKKMRELEDVYIEKYYAIK